MVGRRRGRKRRIVVREPNGRAQRYKVSPEAIAEGMPHRAFIPRNLVLDHRAESVLGRRFLNGKITEEQYEAGIRWRDLVGRYCRVIDAPASSPRSPAGALVGPSGGGREMDDDEAIRIKGAHKAASDHVIDTVGLNALRAVSQCAVYDKTVDSEQLAVGLSALASHFRLTGIRKSVVTNRQSQSAS